MFGGGELICSSGSSGSFWHFAKIKVDKVLLNVLRYAYNAMSTSWKTKQKQKKAAEGALLHGKALH
jgi:hypothetical protein